MIAIDGTKLAANAAADANRTVEQLAEEILAEAARTDAAEDAVEEARGRGGGLDLGGVEAAEELRRPQGRRGRLRKLLEELNAEAAQRSHAVMWRSGPSGKRWRAAGSRVGRPSPDSARFRSRQHANLTDPG